MQRAGGLTDLSFAEGAVFLRADLRLREQEQLNELAKRSRAKLSRRQPAT